MIPDDVREAAVLLSEWCLAEGQRVRALGRAGPAVMLFDLVGSVCEYLLERYAQGE